MVRFAVCTIILALNAAVTVCCAEPATPMTGDNKAARMSGVSTEPAPLTYHLVTMPSTNKKRVDAMCIKFLSIIPKAKLIPKMEVRTVFRLVANSYDKLEAAKKRKTELTGLGIATFVAVNDTGYSVIAGSHFTEPLALEEQRTLTEKNVSTTIHELRLPLKEWQMISTESFTIRDAVIMASRLAKIGVITTLQPAAN